jgi:S-adenosylmethionine hydrolase
MGAVLKIDRFGNLITNFHVSEFPTVQTRPFVMAIGAQRLAHLARSYAEGNIGDILVIVGSSGYLEIASNQASAAKILGCAVGAPAELTVY